MKRIISWLKRNNMVAISKKVISIVWLLLILVPQLAFADIIVKGQVRNQKNKPIPDVSVSVKGTSKSTVTNDDGQFVIHIPNDNVIVKFSCIGYKDMEVSASESMEVVLQDSPHTLGEVIVTTQKRRQRNIDVPIAISALSGKSLEDMDIKQMDEMSEYIPGVEIQLQSPNNPGYVIRGVTSDEGESYSQPRVSVYQDGVSSTRSRGSVVEPFDLERVEVVKGPQSTLFGRGAEIGAISFIRNKPVNYLTGSLSVNYGTHNQRGATGVINTPIIKDKLANRFAFTYDAHDGFIKNLRGGRLNGKSAIALRNSTRWFADHSIYDLVLDYQHDDYPGTSFKSERLAPSGGDTDPNTAAALDMGKKLGIKRNVGSATLTINHDINDAYKLSSISGFRAFRSDEHFDADGTYLPLLNCEELEKGTQFSEELRLNYTGKCFSGFVGGSYFYENSSQEVNVVSDMQNLYPAYLYQAFVAKVEPKISQLAAELPALLPAAYQPAVKTLLSTLMTKWFPSSYDLTNTPTVTNTPDFYGDVKSALAKYGLSLDNMLSSLGTQGATILATLKSISDLPISASHKENGTNYGINQAAEVFADGTFKLTKALSLTAGIRGTYEHQKTGYSSTTVADPVFGSLMYQPSNGKVYANGDYYSWVGRLVMNYMLNKNNDFYASISRGRRPAVIAFNNNPDSIVKLKPEIIISYETGLKGALLNNRLGYELSVYYYDWNHFQTMSLKSGASAAKDYVADDAGKAHTLGTEASLHYFLTKFLSFFGNYSYIDGKFNNKNDKGVEQEYAGNRFRLTPMNSFSAGLDLDLPLSETSMFYFRPSYSYKSKVHFEDENQALTQSGYGLANFTAGVRMNPGKIYYEIEVFGKNVFNKKYIIDAGNSGEAIDFPTFIAGSPSVFGVQLKIGF
jgi:iron complex outermembrane recepter protein